MDLCHLEEFHFNMNIDLILGVVSFSGIILMLVLVIIVARSKLVSTGNVSIEINGDASNPIVVPAGSKLLQTLQASLDRPVFSPVVQGKANATMKTPTGNNSSPVSPMRMKLDSVTRSAQDILMRVRGQRLSENAGFGSDSPSFSYFTLYVQ